MGCAIEVKREINSNWVLPPAEDSHTTNSLLCPERLPSNNVRLKSPAGGKEVKSSDDVEQSLSSGGSSATNSESTESSTDEESKSPLPPLLSPLPSPPQEVWKSPPRAAATTRVDPPLGLFDAADKDEAVEEEDDEEEEEEEKPGEVSGGEGEACAGESGEGEGETEGGGDGVVEEDEEEEEEDRTEEAEKSLDEKSSPSSPSEKEESSPVCLASSERKQPGSGECGVCPVVGEKRRRARETEEEYEIRRLARRESLTFAIDFCEYSRTYCICLCTAHELSGCGPMAV